MDVIGADAPGIGVMLTIPIRVEYLVNPVYGLDFSNTMVLCITMVVPIVTDIGSTPVWGWAYDKFNLALCKNFECRTCFFYSDCMSYLPDRKPSILLSLCIRLDWSSNGWWGHNGLDIVRNQSRPQGDANALAT